MKPMKPVKLASLPILLCFYQLRLALSTTLVDSKGTLTRTSIPQSSLGNGIVAVITSPGTKSFFDFEDGVTVNRYDDVSVVCSPGATQVGSSLISKGNGAVAASSVSGSIVVCGITEGDLEFELADTRHGQTLTGIFRARLSSKEVEEEIVTLIITIPIDVDDSKIISEVNHIFECTKAEFGSNIDFEDLYRIEVETVVSEADAIKIMAMASNAASKVPIKSNVGKLIADMYSQEILTSETSPSATAALLACDLSYIKHYKSTRAKLMSWKYRAGRGLNIDNFGVLADQLISRVMERFDRDTISAAGILGSVASYRMETRSKLRERLVNEICNLFQQQVENLEETTLKKFNSMLLRKHGNDQTSVNDYYEENAKALNSALSTFELLMGELEVNSLALTKAKSLDEMSKKLNSALLSFPDSAAAKLKSLKQVTKTVNKTKQPTERSIDFGLDFVAMIRPDGFGNLQGFGGYQLGTNNIIVGVHNDADSPDVIAQFGGKRPPLLRFQPKLKVDVEL